LVYRTQAGKRIGQMGMGDLRASPGEPKKATEGGRDRVEHSQGKGIKLRVDERDDGGAVATEHGLEAWIIGQPHIDALGQQCDGCRVGAGADQGQKLCNRCGSTRCFHSSQGTCNRKHTSSSYAETSKDYATGTAAGRHTRSLGRDRGTYSGAGHCRVAPVLSQCERDLLNTREQASGQLTH